MPSACRDAPLGQRQGGVFRLPPPYLWTPPTPQRAKGYSPLTILKQKSKHKKASAAPVGAIALTLFSLLHLKPLSRCATAPPRGASAAAAVSRYDPSRENSVWSAPQSATNAKYKIILPLNMARAQAEAILNRPASEGVHPQTTEGVLRLFYKKRCISAQKGNCRLVYFVHLC